MAGIRLLVALMCISCAVCQNSINDLMTLQMLDIDIPDAAYRSILGGRGRGGLGASLQQLTGRGRTGPLQQQNTGFLGNIQQQQQQQQLTLGGNANLGGGINLGQSQQLGLRSSINGGTQQLGLGNAGGIQQLGLGNAGLGQAQQIGAGNLRLNTMAQPALLGNSILPQTNSIHPQTSLTGIGNIGHNTLTQQSLQSSAGLGGIRNIGGQSRLSGSIGNFGAGQANSGLLRSGGQRFGQVRSLGRRGFGGNRRVTLG